MNTGDVTATKCIITPINPSFLSTDDGINNGTLNVMINCNCINVGNQQIKWYSPDKKEVSFNYTEPEDMPYVLMGTLIIPIFNNSYQGAYYCGVMNDSMFGANINLTLWTGMYGYACVRLSVCQCILRSQFFKVLLHCR